VITIVYLVAVFNNVYFCRIFLHDANMTSGNAYFYNGVCMLATFCASRILPMPYCYYLFWKSLHPDSYWHLPVIFPLITTLDVMNLFWFHKMIVGSLKIIRRRQSRATHLNGKTVTENDQVTLTQ